MVLANWLKASKFLTHLKLTGSACGIAGFKHIFTSLLGNDTILHLELQDNHIDDATCQPVADWLANNRSLISLDMSRNDIGNDGAEMIGKAIGRHSTIQNVMLYGNEGLGVPGFRHLCEGVTKSNVVRNLYVNSLRRLDGPEVTRIIIPMLKENTSLRGLSIHGVYLSANDCQLIQVHMKKNTTLLNLNCTYIHETENMLSGYFDRNWKIRNDEIAKFKLFERVALSGEIAKLPKNEMETIKGNIADK